MKKENLNKYRKIKYICKCFTFQILVPILSNEKNHEQWPRVVSADIIQQVHNLKRNVDVVIGQVKGKTLLPLPVGIENIEHLDVKYET